MVDHVRIPIAISLGAIAGALTRYYLSLWIMHRFGTNFPYGTFFINLTGCLAMGFFVTLALERIVNISPEIRVLVSIGFLGSYTTFSTYSLESLNLMRDRATEKILLYWLGSAILGVASTQLGIIIARFLR